MVCKGKPTWTGIQRTGSEAPDLLERICAMDLLEMLRELDDESERRGFGSAGWILA